MDEAVVRGRRWRRAVGYPGRLYRHVQWTFFPIARLARTNRERLSALRFLAKTLALQGLLVLGKTGSQLTEDTPLVIQGITYYVGLRSNESALFRELTERSAYDAVPGFVAQRDWIVFDVGANIGIFAVAQARRGARVYAFEPNPEPRRRLVKTVQANGLDQAITVLPYALSSEAGHGTLSIQDNYTPGAAITVTPPSWNEPAAGAAIDVTTLDDVAGRLAVERIDLIKIDTEGAETAVLTGAGRSLRRVERIVLEYHGSQDARTIETLLVEQGFVIARKTLEDVRTGIGLLFARRSGGEMAG